jgi:hypothetical protein
MSLLNEASFLVTPNGYKEDKLYAAIPTNGNGDMTFARASTATRVNEAGLVELVPYNLLLRSQEFNNTSWGKTNTTISVNAITAPDGTLTADTWTGNGNSGIHHLAQTVSVTSGVAYTQSVFAKKGTNNFIQIIGTTVIYDSYSWANFDLDNGEVSLSGDSATATITDFGNGWYRCTMTATATATESGAGFLLWLITSADSDRAETNSLGKSVYLWGAQVVKGSSALTYQKTVDGEDIPRIDYTDAKRTNLLTYSENFDDASFIKGLSLPIETDSTTAPDGTLTADTWTGNGVDGVHKLTQTVSATSGVTYTQSVFAKKGTNDFIQILGTAEIYDSNSYANFDLDNGDVGNVGTSATATITDFGNGWYRCTMTATATATASGAGFTLRLITSATSERAETNSLATSVYLWGAQLEAGAYPTSYIPTHTMPVTIYDGCPSILLEPAED